MDTHINSERQSYRRGLVLGFTVAEALLLILFGLLLALGSIIVKKTTEVDEVEAKRVALAEELERAKPQLSAFADLKASLPNFPNGATPDEFFQELVRVTKERDAATSKNADLSKQNKDLVNSISQFQEMEDFINGLAEGDQAAAEAMQSAAAKSEALDRIFEEGTPFSEIEPVLELAKQLDDLLPPQGDPAREEAEQNALNANELAKNLRDRVTELERSNDRLSGQFANATRLLEQEGKGYAACWAEKFGRADFIFDVSLRPDGILVLNNDLPQWRDEQAKLPISNSLYNRPLSMNRFRTLTRPIFNRSEEMDCRFFVRIFDMTGETEKELYKQLLDTVENHFYKDLMSNNNSWRGPKYTPAKAATKEEGD